LEPENNLVTFCPEAPSTVTTAVSNYIADRIASHKLKASLSDKPTHGLVTKTGHIYLSDTSNIQAQVYNSQSNYKEILVFARFNPIPYPVENTPTFEAYYNEGTESFYEFYKNSNNPYESGSPKITSDLTLKDPSLSTTYTFNSLMTKVTQSVSAYNQSSDNLVLIGIYGDNNGEQFSIVPYGGLFPQPLSFNMGYHNYYMEIIQSLLGFIGTGLTQYSSVKAYIDETIAALTGNNEEEDTSEPAYAVPLGGIIMWSGTTVPNNYQLCDGTNGTPNLVNRFIMGGNFGDVGKTGGQSSVTLTKDNIPAHTHGLPWKQGKWGDNANNRKMYPQDDGDHATGQNDGSYTTGSWGSSSPSAISTLPPYYVLAFIMRVS
jgi:hypothetical protein